MNNWVSLWQVVDGYFSLFWDMKIWGIPLLPLLVGVTVVGLITKVFLITARSDEDD